MSGGVLAWPWEHVLEVLRVYGPDIGALATKGDALARRVRERYQYAYDHPNDLAANRSLREALNEYLQRDLTDHTRYELAGKYDHRIDSFEKH